MKINVKRRSVSVNHPLVRGGVSFKNGVEGSIGVGRKGKEVASADFGGSVKRRTASAAVKVGKKYKEVSVGRRKKK